MTPRRANAGESKNLRQKSNTTPMYVKLWVVL